MGKFFEIVDKFYKPVAKGAGIFLGLLALYVIGTTIHAASIFSGWFTFLYVLYWIAVVALILSGIYVAFKWFVNHSNAAAPQQAQAANTYAQQQNVQNNAAATNDGAKVCSACGATVAAGNQFCQNCGNKIS